MKFRKVSRADWKLRPQIESRRKKRLLETPFDEICRRVLTRARFIRYGRELEKTNRNSWRVLAILCLPTQTVDLIHNGAAGYRAQFYLGVRQGERANRYLINALLEKLERFCRANPKRRCHWDFMRASLCERDAKVWIHQGHWFRTKKLSDRNLEVVRWVRNGNKMELQKKNIPVWARLTPAGETRLDLKGGWINEDLKSVRIRKKFRSREIRYLGYT